MTDTSAHTVVLKPGDVLLVGNVGAMGDEAVDALHEGLTQLRFALSLSSVAVFEQDIETAALAPIVPWSDAVVCRLFSREALAEQREALAAWLKANGIDPGSVAADWLSIERAADQRLIRYEAYRLNEDGRRLRDPRSPDQAWTVERVSPLVVDLDLPADIRRDTE